MAAALGQSYEGALFDAEARPGSRHAFSPDQTYVCKVDEAVKGRFKKGLVRLNVAASEIEPTVAELHAQGFRYVLVEPQFEHGPASERYFSLVRTRDGLSCTTNDRGGVDVNDAAAHMKERLLTTDTLPGVAATLGISSDAVKRIAQAFEDNHFGFLEINPLVPGPDGQPYILDAAVEVDGEAAPLVAGRWSAADLRSHQSLTPEESAVLDLAARSMSSFRLVVLNPHGQIFLLLSGGGASVTLADEVHNQGFGHALGNYGEYSGNPTADETYMYTRQILSLLIKSAASPKVLVVAGGVANFTDIRVTFSGVIRALEEVAPELARQGIKVFVRRGGPHEAEGLARIETFLRTAGLLGAVSGPELMLSEIIPQALSTISGEQS